MSRYNHAMPSILIIDDEEPIAWALRRAFERERHAVAVAATAEDGLAQARQQPPDVVFLDVRLPGMDGLTALAEAEGSSRRGAAVIVITAHGNLNTAVKAVEGGAFDYLAKPFDLARPSTPRSGPLDAKPDRRAASSAAASQPIDPPDEIVGRSPAMQTVFKRIALVAPTTACVLITGESGTGKELVARAIHANSPRRGKPFLPVHVAALNPNLVESELFGHVQGAFTGADKPRDGPARARRRRHRLPRRTGRHPAAGAGEAAPRAGAAGGACRSAAGEAQPVDVRIVSATPRRPVRRGARRPVPPRPVLPPERLPDPPAAAARPRGRHPRPGRALPAASSASRTRPRAAGRNARVPEVAAVAGQRPRAAERAGARRDRVARRPAAARALPRTRRRDRPGHASPTACSRWWPSGSASGCRRSEGEPGRPLSAALDAVEPALLDEVLRQLDGNRLAAARWLGLARATVRKMIRKYHPTSEAEEEDE